MKTKKLNCWNIVEKLDWGADYDCDRILNYLMDNYTKPQRRELHDFCEKKVNKLYRILDKYSKEKTGCPYSYFLQDDSGSDLRCHIIGLGKEEYENVIKNPELARIRGQNREYRENFCFRCRFAFN